MPGAVFSTPNGPSGSSLDLAAVSDDVATHRVFLGLPRAALTEAATPITLVLTDNLTGEERRFSTVFRGPDT